MTNFLPPEFDVKDHFISQRIFKLVYNSNLHLYKTEPQPNENELNEYYQSVAYISHTDANKSIFDKAYQFVKRITLISKLNLIERLLKTNEKTLLDIGCGTGDFLLKASKANWNTVGVEPNPQARDLATIKLKSKTNIFTNIDSLIEEKIDKKFSIITLWHVLEHIPNYDDYISKIKSLLAPNGFLLIAVPNFNAYDAKYYHSYWAAFDVPRHLWHFSKTAINKIITNHNMHLVEIKPMWFDAFYVSLLSEKYKTSKSKFIKPLLIASYSNLKAIFTKEYSSLIYVIKNNQN